MRHRKKTAKLGRKSEHRNMMLANMVCCLIKERRITTTLAKARAVRRGDAAQLAILEWVDAPLETSGEVTAPAPVAEPTPEPAAPVKEVASEETPAEETPAEEPKAAETKTEPAAETKVEPTAEAKAEAGEEKKDDEKK